mmetsp:Transcript_21016/g.58447  ORF Transcript_21016/g.58447 Transcript_21016/m.58447 type:complete len:321 (-) Transcript_21016:1714-2676(-)
MERVSSSSEEATIKSDSIIEAIPTTSIATGDLVSSPSDSQVTRLEHLLDVSKQHSIAFDSDVRIDVSSKDYRAFCLLIHREQGALLLHCTRKKKKPPHYQLPGGHIDVDEFQQVAGCQGNVVTQEDLYRAARIGCARELYEETGIDFRNRLEDFFPMVLYSSGTGNSKQKLLINEYNHRLLFVCEVKDEDFPTEVCGTPKELVSPLKCRYFGQKCGCLFKIPTLRLNAILFSRGMIKLTASDIFLPKLPKIYFLWSTTGRRHDRVHGSDVSRRIVPLIFCWSCRSSTRDFGFSNTLGMFQTTYAFTAGETSRKLWKRLIQ